ncbi:hypothetical protein RHGRI_004190 [Rhododendron griersonianum]|uniref:Reverse transcriptase Ty1/copia-type domain-containing protein n=1 Tax=Rhododendron griersonianum TaxID=479676 RepID=A0AAV6L7P8_9ERIC|nr:hypothetical protein RHGRI_004190 [Rhododendron griersonianum]
MIRPILNKTPYELWKGRKPNISHFRAFGCKCFVHNNDKDDLGKFDARSNEGIFIGYSTSSKAYRVFNKRTLVVEESVHVAFDETDHVPSKYFPHIDNIDDEMPREISVRNETCVENAPNSISADAENSDGVSSVAAEHANGVSSIVAEQTDELIPIAPQHRDVNTVPREWRYARDQFKEQIIGDPSQGMMTRSSLRNVCNNLAFLSQVEPKSFVEAEKDESWILAMQEELNQFERNQVWTLVPKPENSSVIGTKWVFKNKMDESGVVVRNKARLVAQGYNQEEGIDFDETFAPVARLEAIRMLLAFACYKNFKLFQMDVKSAFLNGFISEEVFVKQPPGFQNHEFPDHVFKLSKALYGLKQAPRAWYDRLSKFLIENGFSKGKIDTTLFIKTKDHDILVVQIYVDDIIFGATNESLCKDFAKCMQGKFEMSMMGELTYFLGLQIKQSTDGIFINQFKYIKDLLKKFDMEKAKPMGTPMSTSTKLNKDEMGKPFDEKKYRGMIGSLLYLTASRPDIMFSVCLCARFQSSPKESHYLAVKRIFKYLIGTPNLGLWYPKGTSIDLIGYSDADFAGCAIDRKSTSGTCQFLGDSLVSWFSKKQHYVALSIAEAEYVAVGSCCAQVLWMKQQLDDFGLFFDHIPIKCDNTSAINLTKNLWAPAPETVRFVTESPPGFSRWMIRGTEMGFVLKREGLFI